MFEQPWIGFSTSSPVAVPAELNGCSKKHDPCLITITSLEKVSRSDGNVLIRLEHVCTPGVNCKGFDNDEHFDFKEFFAPKRVVNVVEYNLIGNYPINHRERLVWNTTLGQENNATKISDNFVLTLQPTDLKTFIVDLQ